MAQMVKGLPSIQVSSGIHPVFLLSGEPASPSPSAAPLLMLSLSQINQIFKKIFF